MNEVGHSANPLKYSAGLMKGKVKAQARFPIFFLAYNSDTKQYYDGSILKFADVVLMFNN